MIIFAVNLPGTRAPSPARVAGEGARVPRQSSEITVSYMIVKSKKNLK